MINFDGAFKGIGKSYRRIDQLQRLLSHPHGVCEYASAILRLMESGTSTQVIGVANHFLLVVHAYNLKDITLDERLYERYMRPYRWEQEQGVEADGLNALFAKAGQIEQLQPAVNSIMAHVDDEEEVVAEEARKFLFLKFSEKPFEIALLRLCIEAILKYNDIRCRRDCALLFRVVCDRIYLPFADAVKIRDQVEKHLDNLTYAVECAQMLPVIEARIEFARPNRDSDSSQV